MASLRFNQTSPNVVRDCYEQEYQQDKLWTKISQPSPQNPETTNVLLLSYQIKMYNFFRRHLLSIIVFPLVLLLIFNLSSTLSFVYNSNRRTTENINLLYELGKDISTSIQRYNEQYHQQGQLLYWIGGTTSLAAARNIPSGLLKSDYTYHAYFLNEQLDKLQSAFPEDHPTLSLKWLTSLGYYQIVLNKDESIFGIMYPVEWNAKIKAFEWIDSGGKVVSTHQFNIPDKNITKYLTRCIFYDFTFQCMKLAETEKYLSEVFRKVDTSIASFINDEETHNKHANLYNDYCELLPLLTNKIINNMRGIRGDKENIKDNEEYIKDNIFRLASNSLIFTLTKSKWLNEKEIDDYYDIAKRIMTTINEYNDQHPEDPFIYWIGGGTSFAATRNTPSGIFQWDDDLDFSFYEGTDEKLAKVFPENHPTLTLKWCPHCTFYKVWSKSNDKVFADFLPVRWNNATLTYGFIDKAQYWFPTQHFHFPTPKSEDHLIECPFYDFLFPCQNLHDRIKYLSKSYQTDKIMTHAHFKSHRGVHGYYDLRRIENFHFLQPALTQNIVKKMQAFSFTD